MTPQCSIVIVAGEASGDLHGGSLAREILARRPDCRLFGLGGDAMQAAGVEVLQHVSRLGVTGLTEVIARLGEIRAVFHGLLAEVRARRPDLAVLIDYPDFNLRLARRLRRAGVPVVYFISPQLWAWRPGRVKQVARDVARMLVILPFEVDFYRAHGVAACFVGHPLMDQPAPVAAVPDPAARPRVLLLPGSRPNELERLLPVMAAAVERLADRPAAPVFELLLAPTLTEEEARRALGPAAGRIRIVRGPVGQVLPGAACAVVASGTATLEVARCQVPMVVVYRLSALSYAVARWAVKVPHVALVNIVAGRRLVPELIQAALTPGALAGELAGLLDDPARAAEMRRGLAEVTRALGEPGAARRAAAEVIACLPPAPGGAC